MVHAAAAFRQQSIPGKGVGLVAARDIAAGSVVLREPALIAFTTRTDTAAEEGYALQDALPRLTQQKQATYNGLANRHGNQYPHVRLFLCYSQAAHVHDTSTVNPQWMHGACP
jgi:hypothetical protein